MRFRLKAFGLHLLGSACALTLVLGGMYLGWYHWPGWYLTGVLHVLVILGLVDLALGPALTLMVANPGKSRRKLALDVGIIVTVQIIALLYGAVTLWLGRPLYYTFSSDRLEMVQASDLEAGEIALARRENPTLAPHWYSLPRWVWAPLPEDPAVAASIVKSNVFAGGQDIIDMPRYFKPWPQALPELRKQLQPVDGLKVLSRAARNALAARLAGQGVPTDRPNLLPLWGNTRLLVVVFDPDTLSMRAVLRP